MTHLQNLHSNLWELKKQDRFTDLTITIDGRDHRCHRVVLASVPGYFSGLLNLGYPESDWSEIQIRAHDPDDIFPQILKFVYTGDTSWVSVRNALSVYMLSSYFQINELQAVAESFFEQLNKDLCLEVLEKLDAYPAFLLPPSFVAFLASSFSNLLTNDRFLSLPVSVLVNVVTNRSLRIQSDFSLARFVSRLHEQRQLERPDRDRVCGVIQWYFLLDSEWEQIEWRALISEREYNNFREIGRHGRQGAAWTPITRVCALLQRNPDQLLERYVSPPWVQWFTLTQAWFNDAARYAKIGLFSTPIDPTATENSLKVIGEHAIFLKEIKIVITTVPGRPLLFVLLELIESGRLEQKVIEPKGRDTRLEYEAVIGVRSVAKLVAFKFDIRDQKNFRWVSANIVGFVC
jgi:hypothetical protein